MSSVETAETTTSTGTTADGQSVKGEGLGGLAAPGLLIVAGIIYVIMKEARDFPHPKKYRKTTM